MKPNTVSIKEIIGRVKRHPLLSKIPEETLIAHAVDFLRIMDMAETFEEKVAVLDVKDFRAELPEDFYEIIQVRSTSDDGIESHPLYFRSITDNFYKSDNKHDASPYAYKIQGSVIFLSPIREGKIEIAYKAVEMDDCGLPVVPDDAKFIRALEAYIKVREFTILFDLGQIQGAVLQNAQQEYSWAVASATAGMKTPSLDEMESIGNIINSLLPRSTHYRGYADNGGKEIRRIH